MRIQPVNGQILLSPAVDPATLTNQLLLPENVQTLGIGYVEAVADGVTKCAVGDVVYFPPTVGMPVVVDNAESRMFVHELSLLGVARDHKPKRKNSRLDASKLAVPKPSIDLNQN